ncbi:MAG: CRISPR system precrRNA processing endoribonuclease RAMP protein Cas6 [Oscillatoria sp. PMC 1051.18]|nr:CRISPR system precrRNA processing endoribonuclease RAMP protein Cas6 [Oscillatoria sp. PMC 1050.18]MEC5028398.1 CRISPR system precrRNA processing endoribonuclease RAMP protein Cas6 [Oscillatoria sp. PMC 1051.18]
MLIKTTLTLKAQGTIVLPRSYCLALVKILHEKLKLEVGKEAIPSVTCSGLIGRYSGEKDFFTFESDECYQLFLCGLNERASNAIAFLDLADSLDFLGVSFTIVERDDAIATYEELYTTFVANEPEPTRRFNLEFLTPTAFSQGSVNLPLPVPSLLFRSWLERWNHFAPVYLGGDELIGYLENAIALQRHRLKTRTYRLQRGFVSGFIGNIQLQVFYRVDPLLANVAHLLIQYAQFSGTGMKTRLGMGQTALKLI